jgi:prophage maintenance system killer protein
MTTTEVPQTDTRAEYYGDEQSRLADFKQLDYPEFKDLILHVHNNYIEAEHEDAFVQGMNYSRGGTIFPRAEDKDSLLEYALKEAQAKDDIQEAAIILGTAIVFTHPLEDGNGRLSRTIYAWLSRGMPVDATMEDNVEAWLVRQGSIGRDFVDFGRLETEGEHLIEKVAYFENGLEPVANGVWHLSSDEDAAKHHYGQREYHGLTAEEAEELDTLLGEKSGEDGINPDRRAGNSHAVLYGLSKIYAEEGLEMPIRLIEDKTQVITPDALAMMSGDQKRKLTTYIRDFNTIFARSAIDLVSKYGDLIETIGDGEQMRVLDWVVNKTNNFLAPKIGGSVLDKILSDARLAQQ